jgi:hypothetical protein
VINEVYQTVKYILAKDNNGLITPEEFNKYAFTAQVEVFVEYFRLLNLYRNRMKLGRIYEGYSDLMRQLEQTIEYFSLNVPLEKVITPATLNAIVVGGVIEGVNIADPGSGYAPNTAGSVTISGPTGTGASITYSTDSLGNITAVSIVSGGTGYTTVSLSISSLTSTSYNLPSDWYYLNAVNYGDVEVKEIAQHKLKNLLRSNLTAPTFTYPNYVLRGNAITIYPDTGTTGDDVTIFYIRYPRTPNWTYSNITNGEPIFNINDPSYQDFEVSESEVYKLIMKICQYSGVQIREEQVVQYTMQQEALTEQNDNTKT